MAGYPPAHISALIAGVRAQVNPSSEMIEASVGTDSPGHLFLLNGPIREAPDINSDPSALRHGFRSNQTIGRALGLIYRTPPAIVLVSR